VQVLKQVLLRAKRKQRTHQVIQLARREPGKNIGFSDICFSRQNDKTAHGFHNQAWNHHRVACDSSDNGTKSKDLEDYLGLENKQLTLEQILLNET
jgi:hypothetical protein